jgi:hypothetical protein
MRIHNYEQWTVDEAVESFHNDDVLYARNISPTGRYSLANAAAAAGVNTDELLATMDYRLRRAARQNVVIEETEETEEAELVA